MSSSTTTSSPPPIISSGLKGRRTRLNLAEQPLTGFVSSDRGHGTKLLHPWIARRLTAAKQRCENPNNAGFKSYGGRGIQFKFATIAEAYIWVLENLGLPETRKVEIDRIENDGHYEPGNLRWSAGRTNRSHTQRSKIVSARHRFRELHPEVRYADFTLRNLLAQGLTFEEIIARWHQPSCKPKGVYGTCSTADPFIASLHQGD